MEYWDLYDRNRNPLGCLHRRGKPLAEHAMHLVVSVWVFDNAGRILLTRRDPHKESFPGFWENTGGSVVAGESSRSAAVRELREETGIAVSVDSLQFLHTFVEPSYFLDMYLTLHPHPELPVRLQKGETIDSRWVDLPTFDAMLSDGRVAAPIVRQLRLVRTEWNALYTELLKNRTVDFDRNRQ